MPPSFSEALQTVNFRGKGLLFNLLCPKSGVKHTRIFGSSMDLDLSDYIQRQIYLGSFEPHETICVKERLGPGMTFVDVGANVGYYTALAARKVGGRGRVVSFEPSPYAFERLQRLVDSNRLDNVTAVNAGLSDSVGTLNLYLGAGSDNHAPTMVAHQGAIATQVRIVTLDAEAERLGLQRIDLMKIDVEGHEPKVLAGAKRLLKERRIGAVLCEFNDLWLGQAGYGPQDLEKVFQESGFMEDRHRSAPPGFANRFFRLP